MQASLDTQGRLVGAVLLAALFLAVLGIVEGRLRNFEVEFEILPREVLDRRDLGEQFVQVFVLEPFERFELCGDQMRQLQDAGGPPVVSLVQARIRAV